MGLVEGEGVVISDLKQKKYYPLNKVSAFWVLYERGLLSFSRCMELIILDIDSSNTLVGYYQRRRHRTL